MRVTMSVSPACRNSRTVRNSTRASVEGPLRFSDRTTLHPAALSAACCNDRSWSTVEPLAYPMVVMASSVSRLVLDHSLITSHKSKVNPYETWKASHGYASLGYTHARQGLPHGAANVIGRRARNAPPVRSAGA